MTAAMRAASAATRTGTRPSRPRAVATTAARSPALWPALRVVAAVVAGLRPSPSSAARQTRFVRRLPTSENGPVAATGLIGSSGLEGSRCENPSAKSPRLRTAGVWAQSSRSVTTVSTHAASSGRPTRAVARARGHAASIPGNSSVARCAPAPRPAAMLPGRAAAGAPVTVGWGCPAVVVIVEPLGRCGVPPGIPRTYMSKPSCFAPMIRRQGRAGQSNPGPLAGADRAQWPYRRWDRGFGYWP